MKLPKELVNQFRDPYISELGDYINSELELIVKVKSKRLMENRTGQKYLLLTFEDKTGILRAIDWFNAEKNDSNVDVGNVVKVSGKVVVYDGRLQFNLLQDSQILVLKEGEYSPERFIKETKHSVDSLMNQIYDLIENIKNKYLKELLSMFFKEDKEFLEKFKNVPAGAKVHHNYVGGLVEHSYTVAKLCENVCSVYENLDRDLLITGALLHDIGKIEDYEVTSSGIEVTTQGELIGHIVSGYEMVKTKLKKINAPKDLANKLLHMIISHHGELEWGSPVVPKTPEALVLHMIENMDSKLNRIFSIKERELDGNPEKAWSEYDPNLGRRFYLKHELDD